MYRRCVASRRARRPGERARQLGRLRSSFAARRHGCRAASRCGLSMCRYLALACGQVSFNTVLISLPWWILHIHIITIGLFRYDTSFLSPDNVKVFVHPLCRGKMHLNHLRHMLLFIQITPRFCCVWHALALLNYLVLLCNPHYDSL